MEGGRRRAIGLLLAAVLVAGGVAVWWLVGPRVTGLGGEPDDRSEGPAASSTQGEGQPSAEGDPPAKGAGGGSRSADLLEELRRRDGGPGLALLGDDQGSPFGVVNAHRDALLACRPGSDVGVSFAVTEDGRAEDVFVRGADPAQQSCVERVVSRMRFEGGRGMFTSIRLDPEGGSTVRSQSEPPAYERYLGWPGVSRVAVAAECAAWDDWACIVRMLENEPLDGTGLNLLLRAYDALDDLEGMLRTLERAPDLDNADSRTERLQAILWRRIHGEGAPAAVAETRRLLQRSSGDARLRDEIRRALR